MGMLDGKVALITGGSRGQGRAHAVTSAREGADVIIVDIAEQMSTVPYPMARQGDLDETVKLVEAYDRRALAIKADVRSQQQLDQAVARGIAELGKIDILITRSGGPARRALGVQLSSLDVITLRFLSQDKALSLFERTRPTPGGHPRVKTACTAILLSIAAMPMKFQFRP
jgi:NAD(P)-dependent dehydrogenase (short-subunit alcohol dehydrogenase family)